MQFCNANSHFRRSLGDVIEPDLQCIVREPDGWIDDLPISAERGFIARWLLLTIQDAQYYANHRHLPKSPERQASYEESVEIHAEWITSQRFFNICEHLDFSPFRWSSLIMDVLNGKRTVDATLLRQILEWINHGEIKRNKEGRTRDATTGKFAKKGAESAATVSEKLCS
jgi:hypothetical protein